MGETVSSSAAKSSAATEGNGAASTGKECQEERRETGGMMKRGEGEDGDRQKPPFLTAVQTSASQQCDLPQKGICRIFSAVKRGARRASLSAVESKVDEAPVQRHRKTVFFCYLLF